MKNRLLIFCSILFFTSCDNSNKENQLLLSKEVLTDSTYKISYSTDKSSTSFFYNNGTLFMISNENRNKKKTQLINLSPNNIIDYSTQYKDGSAVKIDYTNGIASSITEYKNFENRTINQNIQISNIIKEEESKYYFIKKISENSFELKINSLGIFNDASIVIGEVNKEKTEVIDEHSDTLKIENNIIKFDNNKKSFEGIINFTKYTDSGRWVFPLYFRFPSPSLRLSSLINKENI